MAYTPIPTNTVTPSAGRGIPAPTTPLTTVGRDKPVIPTPTVSTDRAGSVIPAPAPQVAAPSAPVPVAPIPTQQTPTVAAPVAPVPVPAPTADTPPPAATAESDKAVTEAAEKARVKVAADQATKEAEAAAAAKTAQDKATADAAAAAQAASGVTHAPTDTPAATVQKTEAQQTFDDLMAKAQEWLNAKEDPASKLAFSKAIIQSALVNQEAMNATKAAIAGNPALAGQPAGDALLALRAGQIGTTMAELKGNLAISEQRAISELNQKGFDAVAKLNEIRKTDDEKNLSSYGTLLDEMIKGGADEATLNDFFESHIKPLLPNQGAGLTLDQFRNAGTRAQLLSGAQSATQKLFREAIVRGDDLASIRQLLDSSYTPEQLTSIGKDALKGKSLEEVNAALKAAGYDEVEDLSDLIGNEDMLGEATTINNARTEAAKKPYDDETDDLLQTLTSDGYELTPELEAQVKSYVIASSLPGFDPASSVPPWKNDATAYLWDSWPLPGAPVDKFGKNTIDDTQSTHFIYERNAALDNGWERYVRDNPDEANRLSRKDWYAALSKEMPDIADGTQGVGKLQDVLGAWTPPKKKVEAGDRVLAAQEGKRAVDAAKSLKDVDWTDPNVVEYLNGSLTRLTDKDVTKALAAAGAPSVVNIGGKAYRVLGLENVGGGEKNDYIRMEDQDGNTVWIKSGTSIPLTALPKSAAAATPVTAARGR